MCLIFIGDCHLGRAEVEGLRSPIKNRQGALLRQPQLCKRACFFFILLDTFIEEVWKDCILNNPNQEDAHRKFLLVRSGLLVLIGQHFPPWKINLPSFSGFSPDCFRYHQEAQRPCPLCGTLFELEGVGGTSITRFPIRSHCNSGDRVHVKLVE